MTISNRINKVYYYLGTKAGLRNSIIAALVLVLCAGAFAAYHWYSIHREEQAHKVFARSMEEFEQAVTGDDMSKWSSVEQAFAAGYKSYSSSSLAPYFLAFQAEAQVQQNKLEEARTTLANSLKHIAKSSPLYYLYATKLALMSMDAEDMSVHESGKKMLAQLADDQKNPQRDMALYYLGYCSFVAHDRENAEIAWSKLLQSGADSVWAHLAQAKLEYSA